MLVSPLDGVSVAAPGMTPVLPVNGTNTLGNVPGSTQWHSLPQQQQQQQQPSLFPATGNQLTGQQFVQSVTGPSSYQVGLLMQFLNFVIVFIKWFSIFFTLFFIGFLTAMEFITCF